MRPAQSSGVTTLVLRLTPAIGRVLRTAGLAVAVSACALVDVFAQTPPLVFTVPVPPERPSSDTKVQASAVVEERALALWGGDQSDFGVGVALSVPNWTVRSITSVTPRPIDNHSRPTFQQIEVVRSVFSNGSLSVAGGGGIRQEWDGTRTLIGRVLAGSNLGPGRLQASVVMERAESSPLKHDAADVVTTLGWSRPISDRVSVGVEGIGQDLEGLWDPAELDGGAKLLVGPSLQAHSKSGEWAVSLTAGPVLHRPSIAAPTRVEAPPDLAAGRHFGVFASASWTPSTRR
jgi:hypothetical protein